MSVKYNTIPPSVKKDEYNPNTQVSFDMSFQNEKLMSGSVILSYQINITDTTGTNRDAIYYDNMAGGHGFLQSIVTSAKRLGQLENIDNYGRYVAMHTDATQSADDMFNSSSLYQGKLPDYKLTWVYHTALGSIANATNIDGNLPPEMAENAGNEVQRIIPRFYLKLSNVLNNMYNEDGSLGKLSFQKSGILTMNLTLPSNLQALFGPKCSNTSSFSFKDIRLHYMTVPEDGNNPPLLVKTKSSFPQQLNSSTSTVQAIMPGIVEGFAMSFIRQSDETNVQSNNLERQQLPNLERVEFVLNDNNSEYINFPLLNKEEILINALEAFNSDGRHHNNLTSAYNVKSDDSRMIGLKLAAPLDMTNQKMSATITSSVQSTDPFTAYIYVHQIMQI